MGEKSRSPITTHVLDLASGKPAAALAVHLERQEPGDTWRSLKRAVTNADGRVEDLLTPGSKAELGVYRLTFETATAFYPYVAIVFEVKSQAVHCHVPLLLSPYGYSTYKGS